MPAVDTATLCALCGAPIPRGAPFGQCPKCLLSLGSSFDGMAVVGDDLLDATQVRSLGDYELIEEIARGGMGVVYRARQLSLRREVAVKMILAGELATAESVQRFRNEAAVAAKLDHPNIVSVYEIGEHETQHYFSMRLVLGRRNIATWAKELQPPQTEIAAMMAKVARAVAFAHDRGVLHRDLKPANILVDEKGEPQVTDFGLAKLVNHDSGLTLSVAMLGSPSYMAPEQADGRHRDVTTATDVYGLGAVLYELLAGRPPFLGPSPLATAKLVVEQMPERLRGAPRDLETLCLKCLAKEPTQRYVSALAVAEDLERFASGESIRARPLTAPEAVWRWGRRHPKIAALLGALVLAFVLGFAGVTWQWRRAEQARIEQQKAIEHLHWKELARQAETDEAPVALAQLAAILRENPERWQAAMLAMSVVNQRAFPVLAGPAVLPEVKLVTRPRLAPDGSWFAAAGEDRSVRVWETATGRERTRIAIAAPAAALDVVQGPLVLAVATKDGAISVRTTLDGAPTLLVRTGTAPIEELRFSADGSHLLARTKEGVEIWKCATPQEPPLALTLDGGVNGADFSADGGRVLTWNPQRAVVWDTAAGKAILDLPAQKDFRRGALAASGKRVALVDGEFIARSWEVDSGAVLSAVESPLIPWRALALNAAGTRLTFMGSGNDLAVHDTASGLRISPPMQHLYQPYSLTVSPDGTRTVSFGKDGRACVWDAETGRAVGSAIWLGTDVPAVIDTSRDGQTVLIYPEEMRDGPTTVTVWRKTRTSPPQRQRVEGQRDSNSGRISPDGRLGCIGLYPGNRSYVYELATGRVLLDAVTKGHVYVQLFSPDMRKCYALTANGWRYGWDLETGAELWPPGQQPGMIRPAEISPDGTRIIAGHNDGHIRVYDTATGALVQTLDHSGEVKTLRFAPDKSGRFLSGSTDEFAHLWNLHTGQKLRTFAGHTSVVLASAWSPDSRLVATASYDQTARVWDVATGRMVGQPMPHLAWLSHLEFSPDGRLLATACRDGTARLWNPLTGEPASAPLPQGDTAETVRFTPDGACFVVRDHSGFRFWDTEKAEPVTVHYSEPASGGLGMDSVSYRDILSPDGTQVFISYSVNEGALWTVPQPRAAVPAWFPDFLEGLALMRQEGDSMRVFSGEKIFALKAQLASAGAGDLYAEWARRVLGEGGR